MNFEELFEDTGPLPGGGGAGGTVVIDVDEDLPMTADDLQMMPTEVGDIHEMADRLREMQSMTMEDVANNRSGSPTEVMEADSASEDEQVKSSPLEVLKKMVEDRDKKRKAEAEESLNIHDMGTSEIQKLKAHVPMELKMPWERGFAGLVLKGGASVMETAFLDEDNWRPHAMLQDDVEVRGQEKDTGGSKLKPSFKLDGRQKMPWAQALETERAKVLEGWKIVIDEARHSCTAAGMLDQSGDSVLDDIFAKKKNGTLQVRLSAMMLYVRWARAKGLLPFPLSEDQVYRYVDQLRRDGAPATRANSFRSALAFCKGTIQLQDVDPVLQSGRVTGSAHRSYLTKRVLRQRDALTVRQVTTLEIVLAEQNFPLQDRIFAGHCLLCIYARLRFGDSQGIEVEPQVEGGYLEGGTSIHKTDSLVGRARRVLPVVAPSEGITGVQWAEQLLKLRHISGLRALVGKPFLPTPVPGGGWSQARLTTPEASIWLCELLQKYTCSPQVLGDVGAHSLKATALSWLAKAMAPEKVRRLLGYHVKPKDRSVVIYSRDALAEGLDILTNVIKEIREGKFKPDAPRNQRWEKSPPASSGVVPASDDEGDEALAPGEEWDMMEVRTPEKSVHRLLEMTEMTSESSEEEPGDQESEDERNLEAVVVAKLGAPKKATTDLYRHGLTGTVHCGSVTPGKLACGRAISAVMIKLEQEVHAWGSKCKVCEGYTR